MLKDMTHGSVSTSLTVGGRVGVGLCCKKNILSERERNINKDDDIVRLG